MHSGFWSGGIQPRHDVSMFFHIFCAKTKKTFIQVIYILPFIRNIDYDAEGGGNRVYNKSKSCLNKVKNPN